MDQVAITLFVTTTFAGVDAAVGSEEAGSPEVAWGDTFFIYDPDRNLPDKRRFPFATIVTKDYGDFDNASNLNRPDVFRLNIGIRTLTSGVTMTITARDKDGATVKSVTKTFGPTFFVQLQSGQLLDGYALTGGETITFDITSGSAFVYGATTDNTTNDPSVQFARRAD